MNANICKSHLWFLWHYFTQYCMWKGENTEVKRSSFPSLNIPKAGIVNEKLGFHGTNMNKCIYGQGQQYFKVEWKIKCSIICFPHTVTWYLYQAGLTLCPFNITCPSQKRAAAVKSLLVNTNSWLTALVPFESGFDKGNCCKHIMKIYLYCSCQ
jgi:hypothetical protein